MPEVTTIGTNILALLGAITYLQTANGGTLKRATDPKQLKDFSIYAPPFAILVPDGETVQGENLNVGGAYFETMLHWSLYLGASSFALEGEGTTGGSVIGDPGIEAMIDDVTAKLMGQNVGIPAVASKMFPGNPFHRRFAMTTSAVVWQMQWRNQWRRNQ